MDLDPMIVAALGCLGGLDVPDITIRPAQLLRRSGALPPERRLMMAVLARALLDHEADTMRRRLVGWRRAARASVVCLSVEGSAAARPAASRIQGLACAG
jgi:hypothetical protein